MNNLPSRVGYGWPRVADDGPPAPAPLPSAEADEVTAVILRAWAAAGVAFDVPTVALLDLAAAAVVRRYPGLTRPPQTPGGR